jgi:N-acetyl sugar amidotransferase
MTNRAIGRVCNRCVMDESDPEITFDSAGICSHCHAADLLLPGVRWTPEASDRALRLLASEIRRHVAPSGYDSVIGLSGGVDSSYTALQAKRMGLNPLAVHFDNGWNSELAVENIQRIVEACGFDLETYVINWREFRDLQRAFLQASVVDIELLTDHAIFAALTHLARQRRVKYLLSGDNIATEHGLPLSWVWNKQDWRNIQAIHAAFGSIPLKTFPHLSTARWLALRLTRQIRLVRPLNLINYRRDRAIQELRTEFGWRDYGGKHHESTFTRFYQGSILPTKFGIDKRRVHLSDQIRNGELTREMALLELSEPVYSPDELRMDSEFVRKKLGFDSAEWDAVLAASPRPHSDFPSEERLARVVSLAARLRRRIRRDLRRLAGRAPSALRTTDR